MKQLKSIVVFSLLATLGFQAAAQDINKLETPYEKARAALADSAVAAIMKNDIKLTLQIGLAVNKMQEDDWSEWKQLEFMEQIITTAWGAYQWGEPETYRDLRAFQRIGPACEEYARKRDALEKTKTPLDIQRENRRYYVPPTGALTTVLIKTGESFSNIMRKGEYEKKAQYRQRIAETGPHIFDSIAHMFCMGHALASIQNATQSYDVESELDTICVWHHQNNKMLATCHISPVTAQSVANVSGNIIGESMKVCVVNGDVLPYKFTIEKGDNYQFNYVFHPTTQNSQIDTNIVFAVSNTGIIDTNILQVMGSHMFDYNKYVDLLDAKRRERIAKEKERKALEIKLADRILELNKMMKENKFDDILSYFENNIILTYYSDFFTSYLNPYNILGVVKSEFEMEFGMSLYEYQKEFQPIRELNHYTNKQELALEYVRKKQLTEKDVEQLAWLYADHNEIIIYNKALNQVTKTLKVLDELMHIYMDKPELYMLRIKKGRIFTSSTDRRSPKVLIEEMDKLKNGKYTTTAYAMLAEFIVNQNKDASKEWEKRKDKYKDIVEFYEHYISEDYKPRK